MKIILAIILAAVMPVLAAAHSVTLGFVKSTDDVGLANSGYTTWRLNGNCPASVTTTTGFTQLNATLFQGTSYVDNTVTVGNFCYVLTFTSPAFTTPTSNPSNTAAVVLLPAPPTSVTVTGAN